jgi:hypothetical protein
LRRGACCGSGEPALAQEHSTLESIWFSAYNRIEGTARTNLQLALSIGIPSILILVGIFLNNARFNSVETRLTTMEGDLRQFYRDLGRHEADIANLKSRGRLA